MMKLVFCSVAFMLMIFSACFGAPQYSMDDFLGMVDGDEVVLDRDGGSSIVILGTNIPKWISRGMWLEVERDAGDFGEVKMEFYLGDSIGDGRSQIELGIEFRKGDELEMKWHGHELGVGAVTSSSSRFDDLPYRKWPDFDGSYGEEGYFHSYLKGGRYFDWTIDEFSGFGTEDGPAAPVGQPLPGSLSVLLVGSLSFFIFRRRLHGMESGC